MPRIARKVSSSSIYHVVNRGAGKQIIFEDDADKSFFMRKLDTLLVDHKAILLAWCLMDNHFHLLLSIPHNELSSFMHRLQTSYAGYFNRTHGHAGSLFGTRFRSEAVDTDAYLMTVVRYIHENPLKGRLTAQLRYQWSSYAEYTGKPIHIDPSVALGAFGSTGQFLSFHQMKHDDDQCMDIEESKTSRLSDERALQIANEVIGPDAILNLKSLDRETRDKSLLTLKQYGLSVRQIQRLTGISLKVISHAGK